MLFSFFFIYMNTIWIFFFWKMLLFYFEVFTLILQDFVQFLFDTAETFLLLCILGKHRKTKISSPGEKLKKIVQFEILIFYRFIILVLIWCLFFSNFSTKFTKCSIISSGFLQIFMFQMELFRIVKISPLYEMLLKIEFSKVEK